jgi:hypothetical protein
MIGRALVILGAGFLLATGGIIALAVLGKPTPDVLQTLAVGAMTAIGALLARSGPAATEGPADPETTGDTPPN